MRIYIRPKIKLGKEQFKVFTERIIEKEGKLTSKAAGAITKFEPPVTRDIGTLRREMLGGEATSIERLPIEQARAKYLANPEMYTQATMGAPPVKQVSQPVPSGSPEELARNIGYERIRNVPIVPPRTHTEAVIAKEYGAIDAEKQLKQRFRMEPEDVRPGVDPRLVLEEKGVKLGAPDLPPVATLAQLGLKADEGWKAMVGKLGANRSTGGRLFDLYRKSSRQASHINTARDYFISSYVRWKSDPTKFIKAYPREAKTLMELEEKGIFGSGVTIPGTSRPGLGGVVSMEGVE